jgi:L-galactose dehydrogenase
VDFVDLIQCHDIEFGDLNQIVDETIPALRAVVDEGKARFVGITGLPLKVFREVIARAEVDTILSYCHYSLNDTTLETLIPFVDERNVGLISASPLSMGLLTQRGAPDWHPAPDEIKSACRRAAQHCQSKGASVEKLAVQFALRNPRIATTLVGSSQSENIEKNVRWLDEPVDEELLREIERFCFPSKISRGPVAAPRTTINGANRRRRCSDREILSSTKEFRRFKRSPRGEVRADSNCGL